MEGDSAVHVDGGKIQDEKYTRGIRVCGRRKHEYAIMRPR